MNKKKILVTGASGRVGQVVLDRLGETYELSALNRSRVAGVPCTQADIADLDGIVPAFEGVDAVLHLAASTMAGNWESLLATNIVGVRNVYEAARIQGVKRVVNISSGATILGYGLESPYKDLLPVAGEYEKLPEQWPLVNERWPIRPGQRLRRQQGVGRGAGPLLLRLPRPVGHMRAAGGVSTRRHAGQSALRRRVHKLGRRHADVQPVHRRARQRPIRPVRAGFDNHYRWRNNAHAKEVLGQTQFIRMFSPVHRRVPSLS